MPTTTDPGQKIGAIAHALAEVIELRLPSVPIHAHEPIGQEIELPAIAVGNCEIGRTSVLEAEGQLGASDWGTTWSVSVYASLDDPETAWAQARELAGEVVAAIDDEPTLGGEALEAKAISVSIRPETPDEIAGSRRARMRAEVTVEAIARMPRP